MANFDTAYQSIKRLVAQFKDNESYYLSAKYNEMDARRDFIDKFFEALGWDVFHNTQKNPYEQEVKVEKNVAVGKAQKRADYSFCIYPNFRDTKFYVEAKKPSKNLFNPDYYFQAIRYGWNANTPIVILTDFEEFHIIDSRFKPDIKSALDRQIERFHYSEYLVQEKLSRIYYLLSRESVADNSIEKRAAELPKPKGKAVQKGLLKGGEQSIDESFLEELDEIRITLAKIFKKNNPGLTSEELTEATQRTIDRLVFIRFLEDKLIEGEHYVSEFGKKNSVWKDFINASRYLDNKYNGVVFKKHPIIDSPSFKEADDIYFGKICEDISHENSPYDFNAIPIHILGSIYERFLGKVIHATNKQVKIEEKPEVRKAGGVFYTVLYIVRYIVNNTIGKILYNCHSSESWNPDINKGKTPKEISKLRFIDISCGSGSFLIEIFDTLLRYIGKWYQENPVQAKKDGCIFKEGQWVLSLKQKQEILLNNIYGVDIDSQAVEVTQLSLFLKLLEDETTATANDMQVLFKEKILPDLSKNIVCGNSLIGTDIFDGDMFPTDEQRKINAMNFEDVFPEIMKNGGFDAIVGNPPYVRIHDIDDNSKKYFTQKYLSAKNQYDLYQLFYERGLSLLDTNGFLGFITSNKFCITNYGLNLRNYLFDNFKIEKIVDLSQLRVFKEASTYPYIFIISNNQPKENIVEVLRSVKANAFEKLYNEKQNKLLKGNDKILSLIIFGDAQLIIDKFENHSKEKVIEVYRGRGTSGILSTEPSNRKTKSITNKEIRRFFLSTKIFYRDKSLFEIDNSPKLLMKKICYNLEIASDLNGEINPINTVYVIKQSNTNYSLKYLLGIFNSKALTYFARTKYLTTAMGGGFIELRVFEVEQLPICNIDFTNPTEKSQHDKIVSLVDQMLEAKKQLQKVTTDKDKTYYERRCETIDRQIDRLVYELYGLTEEEIKIVEGKK